MPTDSPLPVAPTVPTDTESKYPNDEEKQLGLESAMTEQAIDALDEVLLDIDPVMSRKIHLVNNMLDEIGWTGFHMKLFCLNGFGYGVDSLQVSLQGIIAGQAAYEFAPSYAKSLTIALYTGMLVGALFWGSTADIIGRKFAFNVSLFICSAFTIIAGAAPSWDSLAFFVAFAAFGAGGNLILDTTILLEYVPHNKQWLITWLAAWWGVGCMIGGFVAWGFMPNYSCPDPSVAPFIQYTRDSNMGWRYVFFTIGALIFVLSILRVTVIRLKETPKFLIGQGRDAELVDFFQGLAAKYNRPCSLTLAKLEACGTVTSAHTKSRWSPAEFFLHVSSLFSSTKISITSVLLLLSWMMIGLAYPLFNVFLPSYLASRGVAFGVTSTYQTWRNYALNQVCGIFGPILAGHICELRIFGRKYTMAVGGLVTMAFFFAYSQVTSQVQNVAYSCVISFTLEIYVATLYGYTVEVLPSAHRATGNGIMVAFNRLMGIISAVIATSANTNTPVPVFICAALYGALAVIAVVFLFEPYGKRAN